MPFQFYDRILDTFDEYLDLKYAFQRVVDKDIKNGVYWKDAYRKAFKKFGVRPNFDPGQVGGEK